jgi:hypothetical protein
MRWLALGLLSMVAAARVADATPLILDFELTQRGKAFVVHNAAYEMTFVNHPVTQTFDMPLPTGGVEHGAVLVDSQTDGDLGQGLVTVTIFPLSAGVPFDGEAGANGTRDSLLKKLGKVTNVTTTAASFGGIRGKEVLAEGVLNTVPWKLRMFVAWDAPRRTLISIYGVFATPIAPANAPKQLDAFLHAFKAKPAP